jgi:hypothetical protein
LASSRQWYSNNDPGQCSDFTIGRIRRKRIRLTAQEAIAALFQATVEAVPKLGMN